MLLSRHQNADKNYDLKTANGSFKNVAQFRYWGTTVTDDNLIEEKIKRRLNCLTLAAIQFRTFCLLVCCRKKLKIPI
jgi:hypothetical protein